MSDLANIFEKYPDLDIYLCTSTQLSTFAKIMTSILYFRQRLDMPVNKDDKFYTSLQLLDKSVYDNICDEDLYDLLTIFVSLAIEFIQSSDTIYINKVVHKPEVINKLQQYMF